MVIGRFQADISTVKLAANFHNMVKLSDGWPVELPSGGEPGARTADTDAQPQLHSAAQPQLNSRTSTATTEQLRMNSYG